MVPSYDVEVSADEHCPNCRSCDTNRSFRGGLGSSTAACASACRTREAIPKRMLTGEQPILKAFSGVPIAMEVMGGRPRSTTRWCMFTAMKGSISWCSRDAAKQISAVSQPSEQRIRQLEPKGPDSQILAFVTTNTSEANRRRTLK